MFLFFFFIEKKMDIIVPLQYVNGLNPVPSSFFFFSYSQSCHICSQKAWVLPALFYRLQIKSQRWFYSQLLLRQGESAMSCVTHAMYALHLLISEFTICQIYLICWYIFFCFTSFLLFFFYHRQWWQVFIKDSICLVLFVCCNMQWQYKEL